MPPRLSIRFERGHALNRGETVSRRSSWTVMRRRLWVYRTLVGYVNARTRQEALDRAAARWPDLSLEVYVNPKVPRSVHQPGGW